MASETLQLTRADLLRHIGRHLGWPRDPGQWDERRRLDAQDILAKALRQAYEPPLLPGEAAAWQWSFLRPLGSLPTRDGIVDYDLPEDFAGLVSPRLLFSSDDGSTWSVPVDPVSDHQLRLIRSGLGGLTSWPTRYALVPSVQDGSRPQRWSLLLDRSQAGLLQFRYASNPFQLSETRPYPLGGCRFSETLLASCVAAADALLQETQAAASYAMFLERLRTSVSLDRQEHSLRNLGPGDCLADDGRRWRALSMTYEGQSYDFDGFAFES